MPARGESMSERRAVSAVRRLPAQEQVETRAVEIASRAEARPEAHEEICAERYGNIKTDITELKADVKELSRDARSAIDELAKKQEGYHRTNSEALAQIVAKSAGERGAIGVVLKNLPLLLTAAMLILTIVWHK